MIRFENLGELCLRDHTVAVVVEDHERELELLILARSTEVRQRNHKLRRVIDLHGANEMRS